MEKPKNCWEILNCGREPGGARAAELGVCPAATERRVDRINSGRNGGRCCWVVTGTLCGGRAQGAFLQKMRSCTHCPFFRRVRREEGANYTHTAEVLARLGL